MGNPPWCGCCSLCAGSSDIFWGSVKIWKASPMSYLVVREGSNRILLPLSRMACWFFSFRQWVRVRWSFGGQIVGSYLGSMRPESSCAMVAHQWGMVQPCFRSHLQYRQVHLFFFGGHVECCGLSGIWRFLRGCEWWWCDVFHVNR